jgi:hydroxymethylbilane synthase
MSIVLGTRGSKLALVQAEIAAKRLRTADPSLNVKIVKIATSGDKDQCTSLSQIGGKGFS